MNIINQTVEVLCFTIENRQFAIPVPVVDTVIRAVAVLPVPNAPEVIHGIFDFHGLVLPVINLRHRLNLPDQPVRPTDVFIIADTNKRKLALVADRADGIVSSKVSQVADALDIDPAFESEAILLRDDGIVLIYDIEKFLSASDEMQWNQALEKQYEKNKPDPL